MTAIAHAIALPHAVPCTLALGAFLKNTICVTKGDRAYLSVIHGDLGAPEAIAGFEASVKTLVAELAVTPTRVAHDLHPDFHSTRFGQSLDLPQVPVQHHHAHAAAIAVENGHDGPVIGLSLDGFGLGPANQAWGGELLYCEGPSYRRLGHLAPLRQPGGDVAAREPWRMAASALHKLGRGSEIAGRWPHFKPAAMLSTILDKGLNSPETSSAGRLFDAACGLLNLYPRAAFEGQAPMALEALVTVPRPLATGWRLDQGRLDFSPLLAHLADHSDQSEGANLFHGTLIRGMAAWVAQAAETTGCPIIALGGGCFFNKVLTQGLKVELSRRGLTALTALTVSPGDPGLSLGQAWIAAHTEV
ncbi:hydrogenase maturation protein HypF [Magnetospirillum sulfuroxidans]|uniref:Hydrogenase maturation protein HypF n=1 Tax=Magnetospirillum sulfuroxidans TaxID=611300 RepID=A0ABS5IG93_9PROT|nr:hydrogenase maturation protein HypF [Magnetospirillum sulfuroxidans]MBR9973453.1 hydrogenase maturation protein HypF [Magnetospirillum sulfuroxidans]